jgi:phosphonate transport system substrate-binding protein
MESLRVTSCMAENADFICRQITRYIAERLKIAAEFINDIPWQERERLLDAGQIHVCWICGLPYVWKADQPVARIELLAAPVMGAERYRNSPIYFSDVVVHRESDFVTFADLRGASWAYNESRSHSGFNLVRYHLARQGETWGYFGRVRESGAHQRSLQMILHHEIVSMRFISVHLGSMSARTAIRRLVGAMGFGVRAFGSGLEFPSLFRIIHRDVTDTIPDRVQSGRV